MTTQVCSDLRQCSRGTREVEPIALLFTSLSWSVLARPWPHKTEVYLALLLSWGQLASLDTQGFPGGSDGKESACNSGDPGSISESGRSLGVGNGYPLQYSCLENSVDRGAWQATAHRVTESDTTEWLTFSFTFFLHAIKNSQHIIYWCNALLILLNN